MKKSLSVALIVIASVIAGWFWQQRLPAPERADAIRSMLADGDTAGYALATEPGSMEFPRDLGPHNDFQTEWWYYTGNLESGDGRLFGYQLTFFRRALSPPGGSAEVAQASSWRTPQIYSAHFAVSDITAGAFHPTEKFSRAALGLAGATSQPYAVWLEDWFVRQNGDITVELSARSPETALHLNLTQTRPPVLQGDAGLSVKSGQRGNASYYYSSVRQETRGTLTIHGKEFAVRGLSWADHEYSTSALGSDDVGWDWFSLQFDNGTALMICQIRQKDGRVSPFSSGTFIDPDGAVTHLTLSDWRVENRETWTSPASGATYPVGWKLAIPRLGLTLSGAALMRDQELRLSTTYWEGAVGFDGRDHDSPVSGRGYVELTGYAKSLH
ncbi:lipocalin-like domain-containing protein [Mycobacterium sp. ML4]